MCGETFRPLVGVFMVVCLTSFLEQRQQNKVVTLDSENRKVKVFLQPGSLSKNQDAIYNRISLFFEIMPIISLVEHYLEFLV